MNKFDIIFMENLSKFKKYVEETHTLPVSNVVYDGFNLGEWIKNQKTFLKNGKLTPERLALLNEVNPYWNASYADKEKESWRLMINSDWKSKVPNELTPIDKIRISDKRLNELLREGIYTCEQYIEKHSTSSIYDEYILECITAVFRCEYEAKNYIALYSATFFNLRNPMETINTLSWICARSYEEFMDKFNKYLSTLTEKELQVLKYRFGLEDDNQMTLQDIGKIYGVTRDRIRQIEAKAIRKLRHSGRTKILYSTNTILDDIETLSKYERSILYRAEIDTEEKLRYFAANSISDSAAIITDYFNRKDEEIDITEAPVQIRSMKLIDIELSVRSYNCLRRAGFTYVSDLIDKYEEEESFDFLLNVRNLGKKSMNEVIEVLEKLIQK